MAKITTVNYDKEKEKHDEVASRTYKGGSGVGSQSNIEKLAKDYVNSNYESFMKGNDYASLAKRYSDQGRRAMDDTVGQVAARTGGLASSYAASAGQQAYGEYMGRLEDAARGLYDSQQAERLNKLGVAQGMQDRDFERWVAQRDFDLTAANNNIAHAQYMDSVADNNREQALSDFSNDVYMAMYLASDEDLEKMNLEDYAKKRDMAVPEGFSENDFEMLKRQIMAARAEAVAPKYGASLSPEELQDYIESGAYGTEKLNNDYYQLYGKNMPGYFGEDYEYDYNQISEMAKGEDTESAGANIYNYVNNIIKNLPDDMEKEEVNKIVDVYADMVAYFGFDLDELKEQYGTQDGK